jgi:hypothetical protein
VQSQMIRAPQEGKVCRKPTEVLAFLAICRNPLLAVLGVRKLTFLKTIKIFVILPLDKRNKTI